MLDMMTDFLTVITSTVPQEVGACIGDAPIHPSLILQYPQSQLYLVQTVTRATLY